MLKKLLSLFVVAVFAFQSVSVFAFSDTDGTDYEQAVNVLSELDIVGGYEDKTYRPDETITRAEFAAMVVRLMDTSVYSITEEQVFDDVDEDHWAFEYVNTGYSIGYFSGDGAGNFNPDVKITYSEIIKTVVTILGYRPLAEAKGGYPTGYIKVANDIDLLDGLSMGAETYVTRGDVALILYNALSLPKLQQTAFGSDSVDYKEDPEHTILTDELKVDRHEGIVTASRHTGLYGASALGKDQIAIGGTKLAVGKSDISAYVGYNLVVYSKEDKKTKDDTVLFYEIKDENTVTTVVADDIEPQTNLNGFVWWDGEKVQNTALAADVQIIVNGKLVPFAVSDDIKPASGTVTLLNNDDDKDTDVVIVRKYSHYVVEKLDATELVIYDKYGKAPIELEPAGKNVDYKILRKGSSAKFKNISEGAVLSVCSSVDGEYIEVHLVTSPVRGVVKSVIDGDTYLIGDDGVHYKRSTDLPDSELIEIGVDGIFYLDIEGRIIKVEADSATHGNYCYLLDAGFTPGMKADLFFKILTSKGDVEILSSAENMHFNGTKQTKENILSLLGGAGTVVEQPLRYSLNSEGAINRIDIPTLDYDNVTVKFRRTTFMFGYNSGANNFFISSEDPIMFQVPKGGNGGDDDYKLVKPSDFHSYQWQGTVSGYDLDGLTVGCVVMPVENVVTEASITGTCCVLTNVTTAINKDGDPVTKLYYMQSGKDQEAVLSDKAVLSHFNLSVSGDSTTPITASDLKPGDVFHIKLDGNKDIISVARVLSVGGTDLSQAPQFVVSRGVSAEKAFGVVQTRIGNGMLVMAGTAKCLYDLTKPSGSIYVYDSRNQTVTKATAADILDADFAPGDPAYAYVRCSTGVVGDVVIFYQGK